MAIQKGTEAPDFTLFSHTMEAFTLSEHRGTHNVLLLFFPGAFTNVCTTELNAVNAELTGYGGAANTLVIGISTDSPFVLAEFRNVHKFAFPLLSDHNGTVSAQYGAKYNHDFTSMKLDRISKRAAFVVDKRGVVQYAEVLDNAGELPDLETIQRVLASLA